jgi:hypothetical protein
MTMQENPLEKLYDDATPPASLRDRVLRATAHGKRRPVWQVALALAAMLMLAFLGGRATVSSRGEAEGPQYLLLLYEGAEYRDDRPVLDIVAEYRRWADSLQGQQVLTRAHRLDDTRLALVQGGPVEEGATTSADPTGLFIVRASSRDAAEAIARTSPHLNYGGRIVLRRLQ